MCFKKEILKKIAWIGFTLTIAILTGCLHEPNKAPVSNAGHAQHVPFGSQVQLNGGGSYDPDGEIFEYKWELSHRPMGSNTQLQYDDQMNPIFTPDLPGVYVAELVVFDGEIYSGRDAVVITVNDDGLIGGPFPHPPVTPPPLFPPFPPHTPPQPIQHGYVALLDQALSISAFPPGTGHGSIQQSQWEVIQQPEGATVNLSSTSGTEVLFTADTVGDYNLRFDQFIQNQLVESQNVQVRVQDSFVEIEHRTPFIDQVTLPGQRLDFVANLFTELQNTNPLIIWELISTDLGPVEFFPSGNSATFIPYSEGAHTILVSVITPDIEYTDSILVNVVFPPTVPVIDPQFDHATVVDGCANCHNGIHATGLPIYHITSTRNCEKCHSINTWMPAIQVDHNEVIGLCMDCHNGITAIGKNANHIATTDQCDACHSTVTMAPVIYVDHSQVIGACGSCHNGIISTGMSEAHIDTTGLCSECHSTSAWTPIRDTNTSQGIPTGLNLTLNTGNSIYKLGEIINVTVTLTNNGISPVEYYRLSGTHSGISVQLKSPTGVLIDLTHPNDPATDTQNVTREFLLPGDSIKREVVWDQTTTSGILNIPGAYEIIATTVVTHANGPSRGVIALSSVIRIGLQADSVSETTAILIGLQALDGWYKENGNSILCRTNESGIIMINNYEITSIQTTVAIPDSQINCSASLNSGSNSWQVNYKSTLPAPQPIYSYTINATTGEIMGNAIGDPAP